MAVITNDLPQLVTLIESNDANVSNEAALILRDLISNGDGNCLQYLLDKFVVSDSEKLLDVICTIREPLDKVLLDKMVEFLRTSPHRCLSLFAQIILKRPTWMYRLPVHPFLGHFLRHLKGCENVSFAVGGLFCLAGLLPILPSMHVHLNDYFAVFLSVIELLRNNSEWPDVFQLHLKVALFIFFQRLYALYPCNFVRFLRSTFALSSKTVPDRKLIFETYIRPMLDHVKLHPLLITASKDEEISKERWAQKEAHDILVECNAVSFGSYDCYNANVIENGSLLRPLSSYGAYSREHSTMSSLKTTPMTTVVNDDRRSASPFSFNPIVLPWTRQESAIPTEANIQREPIAPPLEIKGSVCEEPIGEEWSPSVAVGLSTPPSSRSTTPLSVIASDTSSNRANRTNSFATGERQRKQQENKTRKSFGQTLGRFFNKPDPSRYKQIKQTSSVPPSPMFKEENCNSEFEYPSAVKSTSSLHEAKLKVARESSTELAEEASEVDGTGSRKPSMCADSSIIAAELKRLVNEQASALKDEDVEVGCLTRLHQDVVEGDQNEWKGDEKLLKSRHPSSQSSMSQNLSRHSSFLDAPQMFNSDAGQSSNATFFINNNIDDNETVADLPKFSSPVGQSESVSAVPRLSNSQSVADFIKRMNRMRFHSQCVAGILQQDSSICDKAARGALIDGDREPIFETVATLQLKRTKSCPVRLEFNGVAVTHASITPLKMTPVVCSRRESNQMPASLCLSENQKSFTINVTTTDEKSLANDSSGANVFNGNFDLPFLKFAKYFYPMIDEERKDSVSRCAYEDYDDYLLTSQLLHDMEVVDKLDKSSISKTELGQLRTVVTLLKHQLFYERHKRNLHAERNRRLHGRLKHTSSLEEQNQAQKDQLRLQEIEIQQLIQALSDSRRSTVESKKDFIDKESVLTNRLQTLLKEKDELLTTLDSKLRELTSTVEKNQSLVKELGSCKQQLFNAVSQLDLISKETDKVGTDSSSLSTDALTREALLVAEINNRLRNKLKLCEEHETTIAFLQAKVQECETTGKKETVDLKKSLKKEKNKSEAVSNKLLEFETQLHKRQQQLGELKRQLEEAREVHNEQMKASQMKYRSLVSVCQRQEAHILELYQQLEHVTIFSEIIHPTMSISCSSPVDAAGGGGESKSLQATEAGLRIPSRQGVREVMSYDSDAFLTYGGSSCGSENLYLPFLFDRRQQQASIVDGANSRHQQMSGSVDELDADDAVYAS